MASGAERAGSAGYERFMFDTLLKLPNLGDIESSFALRTVKSGAPLPLGDLSRAD